MYQREVVTAKTRQGSSVANIILGDFHSKKDYKDRSWTLTYLKQRFRTKELEELYARYEQRSLIGTFTTYLVLQSILSIGYIVWTAVQCKLDDTCSDIAFPSQLPDTVAQSTLLAVCIILTLVVYNENVFKKRPWLLIVCSLIIAVSLEVMDVSLILYHTVDCPEMNKTQSIFSQSSEASSAKVPILSLYNHLVIYLFLPISRKFYALIIGGSASVISLTLFLAIELKCGDMTSSTLVKQLVADMVYYASLNFVGFYVRYVGEINMRRGFLDKRRCIDATFKLKYEKEQEENLLLSIIPKHIASQVRDAMWKCLEQNERENRKPFHELFIERHENVSLLFADICKFTQLTTKLPVDKLVKTLNDLFGKFDNAAEHHNCMRIKILGDCYYCVSGVPQPDPRHAHNCVKMGLDMIELIADVRREHGVEVDMRIGIHSGYILSGVIGLRKWQFDIWSRDVTIANAMEAAGTAGAVHVTAQTKKYLGDTFVCHAADVGDNEVLRKNDIQSYLIYPASRNATVRNARRGVSFDDGEIRRRQSMLLENTVQTYQEMIKNAENFMRDEIEKLPLRKFDQWLRPDEINPVFLLFRDKTWERPYLMEYDPLFKFYVMASFVMVNAMGIILLLTEQHPHVPLWIEYTVLFVFLALLLPCLWVSYVWDQIVDPHYEFDVVQPPDNPVLRMFYNAAKPINTNMWVRHVIFFIVVAMFVYSGVLDMTSAVCNIEDPKNYTYRCALALMVIFLFLRIHHLVKVVVAGLCLAVYASYILGLFKSESLNIFAQGFFGYNEILGAGHEKFSHFVYLGVCTIFFFFMDRQHEYMNRLDYQWKRQLKSEQEQAKLTKLINKTLLQNILPQHIANFYLNNQREDTDLYSEVYNHVAVLFATIPDYMDYFRERDIKNGDYVCLETLNEIMNSFDKLLFDPEFGNISVEKIKVISSTYMAACGLLPGRNNSFDGLPTSTDPFQKGEIARTMAKFAAAMMRTLSKLKKNDSRIPDFELRIGLNVGRVIAGVVGVQKPLYDIWGDTVNVAARMDYFGLPGRIQVTKDTAEILIQESVSCSFRDVIDVKGKGPMSTYFVDLTDDYFFLETESAIADETGTMNPDGLEVDDNSLPDCVENSRFNVVPSDIQNDVGIEMSTKIDSNSLGDTTSRSYLETDSSQSTKEEDFSAACNIVDIDKVSLSSVSTVSTIGYKPRVVTVAEIHRRFDDNDSEISTETLSQFSRQNSEQSSITSANFSERAHRTFKGFDGMLKSFENSSEDENGNETRVTEKVDEVESTNEKVSCRKVSRSEMKRDSGYVSQGVIQVDASRFSLGDDSNSVPSSPEPLDDIEIYSSGADEIKKYYDHIEVNYHAE